VKKEKGEPLFWKNFDWGRSLKLGEVNERGGRLWDFFHKNTILAEEKRKKEKKTFHETEGGWKRGEPGYSIRRWTVTRMELGRRFWEGLLIKERNKKKPGVSGREKKRYMARAGERGSVISSGERGKSNGRVNATRFSVRRAAPKEKERGKKRIRRP